MITPNQKTLLERDIRLLKALLDTMCDKELTERGRNHLTNLIERRKDDISNIKEQA